MTFLDEVIDQGIFGPSDDNLFCSVILSPRASARSANDKVGPSVGTTGTALERVEGIAPGCRSKFTKWFILVISDSDSSFLKKVISVRFRHKA